MSQSKSKDRKGKMVEELANKGEGIRVRREEEQKGKKNQEVVEGVSQSNVKKLEEVDS